MSVISQIIVKLKNTELMSVITLSSVLQILPAPEKGPHECMPTEQAQQTSSHLTCKPQPPSLFSLPTPFLLFSFFPFSPPVYSSPSFMLRLESRALHKQDSLPLSHSSRKTKQNIFLEPKPSRMLGEHSSTKLHTLAPCVQSGRETPAHLLENSK